MEIWEKKLFKSVKSGKISKDCKKIKIAGVKSRKNNIKMLESSNDYIINY